jgi:kumamolisin
MAAQGQTIFAAAGDNGAYDNGSTLSVDDPASQPYVVGAGGTTLRTSGAGGAWASETTWNAGSIDAGAGGGGVSQVWTIPSWQTGAITAASAASKTMRNVPDVAMNADPDTGYAIYYRGWQVYGGTSCSGPIWAGFTALVNEQRAAAGKSAIGFLNPVIYAIGEGTYSVYASNFHDIDDGSTNLHYKAVKGYDDATGWGSFQGATLLAKLAGSATTGGGGTSPPSQLIQDPGFENGYNVSPWSMTAGVINNDDWAEPPHSGNWDAWLDGYDQSHTDTLAQTVTIGSTAKSATLTFWLHVDTTQTTRTTAYDTLSVQIRNGSGTVLTTLATYSNLNAATGYTQKSFNVIAYKGETIQLTLTGKQTTSRPTSFVVDDFALNVQ